ncbi:structural maintenance of chromosomes protein 3-like [Nicotiana sylvestris]|uniref:structural maintenance of chromosomes protein 3-like n=1 Tax=Nicotiana sylvestris TaxID=4096 RepID=UPI00388C7095
MAEDSELWDVICDGLHVPMKKLRESGPMVPKTRKEYSNIDRKVIEKNFRAKKILLLGGKVNAITEAKDLQTLTMDELIGNLKTYEMKIKKDGERREPKKEKNLVLKAENNDSSEEDSDMAYLTKRFQKMALAAWGDSSSESEDENDVGDNSMMTVESEENEYDSIFALMAQPDNDEDDDNSEVDFRDVQRNLKFYSPKKLMSLINVLIYAYHSLVEDKDALTLELGGSEQTRDNLVVCVVDLKETISVDYKETIENFSKEKEALVKRVTEIKEERDDLLVVIADLRETIEGLGTESKPGNSAKGKDISSEAHIRLKNELKAVRTSLCVETKKNKHLQTELERVKNDLEKSLKWTWSSEAITTMYANNSGNRQGIGFQREKTPYNSHSKYVTVPDNWLCTYCGNNGHFKENCQSRVQSIQKNKVFAENGTIKGNSQQWFMDSGCSKHMTGNTMNFLSLKALQEGSVSFDNGKKGYILGVEKICNKGNKVEFLSKICTVTNVVASEVVLVAKRYKNIYVADFEYIQSGDLSCLKAVDDDAELWHRRLGHTSFSLLNKLIQKDLVRCLPMSKFKVRKVCDACAR